MKVRTLLDGRTVKVHHNHGIRKRCPCPRANWVRCDHPWHANYSYGGKEYRVSLGKWARKPADYVMLQGEAKKLYRQWIGEIENGPKPAEVATPPPVVRTLDALAADYIRDYCEHPDRTKASQKEMTRQVKTICDDVVAGVRLGAHDVMAIDVATLESWRLARRRRLAHAATVAALLAKRRADDPEALATVEELAAERLVKRSGKSGRVSTNRLRTRFQHLYSWALRRKRETGVTATPFLEQGLTTVPEDSDVEYGRDRRLEGDEEARLLQHAGPHLHACIMAALETGLRKGELLALTWADVHEDRGIIILPAPKTKTKKKARQVNIMPRLAAVLAMRRSTQHTALDLKADETLPGTLHPFGNEIGERVKGVKTAWKLTCQRAGIRGLTFHDLRREAASQMFETPDVDLMTVRDFLGHDNVNQTNTYLSTSAAKVRAAQEKRDKARTRLAQPPPEAEEATPEAIVTH